MADENDLAPTRVLARELRFARYKLTVVEGADVGKTIQGGEDEVSVGTDTGNTLVLTDQTVSRHHFAIVPSIRGHVVSDLGSTNGTRINDVPIEKAYLAANASIRVGTTKLAFHVAKEVERATFSEERKWGRVLGSSAAMRRMFSLLPRIAQSDATLLLEGETGTGKSLLASMVHETSPRAKGPFVVVDCGAIPPNLIESELFGHEKGAFTGAMGARVGAFESARRGTVFLDEVGELPVDMQPKLLRALEDRVIKRIGSNETVPLDIRLIAATNRDLRSEVNRGRFRSDLYYRLNMFRLRVPPLRDRREDIPLLVAHYYEALGGGEPPPSLLADFVRHDWPGNVRELRAAVERTVLLGDPSVWRGIEDENSPPPASENMSFRAAKELAVAAWEREYVRTLIEQHHGNISGAARAVRMDRNHLRELMVRHRIRIEDD